MRVGDISENINHVVMPGTYLQQASWQIQVGRYISLLEYLLMRLLPVLASTSFGLNRKSVSDKGHVQ
jgi:hypothetical protein